MGAGVLRVPGPHRSSASAPDWGWGRLNASQAVVSTRLSQGRGGDDAAVPGRGATPGKSPAGRGDVGNTPGSGTAPWAHRGLPVRVGEDPVDLHLALVGRRHVDPQPSQTGVPRPVDPRHVVAVVVLLQPGRDGVTGDGVTQLAPWSSKPPGMAQSSRDPISAIKPAQQKPMRSQQRMLSSWRRCREDPRDRLSAERTGWPARET